MFYHLILTDSCNLSCRYCRGKLLDYPEPAFQEREFEIDPELPAEFSADLDELYIFLAKDPEPVLTFYGGEPLLRADLIDRILTEAPVQRFMLQTNGLLLNRLTTASVNSFETILISIDGPRSVTDANRGVGVYDRVVANARSIMDGGFPGELIARMTVAEGNDIYRSAMFLTRNDEFSWPALHWQLDAGFFGDYQVRDFARWIQESYNPGISRLVEAWVTAMEETGRVLRWYPFLDTMGDLLLERETRLRCGSGYANYSIMTNGRIAPCPAMIGMKEYYLGSLRQTDPGALRTVDVSGPCDSCDIRGFCGGRCLYSNIVKQWPEKGRIVVCDTVRHLHGVLTDALPRVRKILYDHTISIEDFSHTKYNGCEIIP